ncbi:MAG TPA: DnaA N-terminal domain-containing protein [Anaerolineaceae bacterium]|nr:DnaA N-terminal domain-containing protein [Anaerolineaceae bacterium]
MDKGIKGQSLGVDKPDYQQAWEIVLGELRTEMSRALYETWVQPLKAVGFENGTFTVGAYNAYGRDWVEERLGARITRLLEGMYAEPVKFNVMVANGFYRPGEGSKPIKKTIPQNLAQDTARETGVNEAEEIATSKDDELAGSGRSRKVMLQRAYGSERAKLIQPERGMFVTGYLFNNWLPLLGHSAFTIIMAARAMCYWNPMTGELRNVVETEMGELAEHAAVSVRTVKDVLNAELVQRYFLRYRVRRVMTPNGVRTAGISMQVRMDDPLTPLDQVKTGLMEEEEWYLPEFSGEKE